MIKVKMLARFGSAMGTKFEKGLQYSLPPDYAEKLIRNGLAVRVMESEPEPEPIQEVKLEIFTSKAKSKTKSKAKK